MTKLIELMHINELPKDYQYLMAAVSTPQEAIVWATSHKADTVYIRKHMNSKSYAAYIPVQPGGIGWSGA